MSNSYVHIRIEKIHRIGSLYVHVRQVLKWIRNVRNLICNSLSQVLSHFFQLLTHSWALTHTLSAFAHVFNFGQTLSWWNLRQTYCCRETGQRSYLLLYASGSQPGCRELVPGVPPINTIPWSLNLFYHLGVPPNIYIT